MTMKKILEKLFFFLILAALIFLLIKSCKVGINKCEKSENFRKCINM